MKPHNRHEQNQSLSASQASSARDPAASTPCSTAVQTVEFIVHFPIRNRGPAGGKPQATTCGTSTLTLTLERPVGELLRESDLHRSLRAPISPAPLSHGRVFLVLRDSGSHLQL